MRQFSIFFALVIALFVTGCGGHVTNTTGTTATNDAPPTLTGYTGVYLSTQNAWGKATVIRIVSGSPTSVEFVGNTYSSIADAQAAAIYTWQPNTGQFEAQVSGTISYTDPTSFASPIQMSITITDPTNQADDLALTSGTATFGAAPRNSNSTAAWVMTESQPSATWAEIGEVIQ